MLGAICGSFLNVLIYRIPRGESIIFPGSHCPKCNHQIPFYLNIPLLSYLVLKGKCSYCHQPVSIRYPIVEFSSIVIWLWALLTLEPGAALLFIWLASILLAISLIDKEYMLIPTVLLLFGYLGLIIGALFGIIRWDKIILGASIGLFLLLIGYLGVLIVSKKKGLGSGDFILIIMLGGWIGPVQICCVILLSAILGLVVVSFSGKYFLSSKGKIPFAPFLSVGTVTIYVLNQYFPNIF